MKRFIIGEDFFDLFPDAKIGIITFYDIDNTIKDEYKYKELLRDSEKTALNHLKIQISVLMM